MLLAPPSLDNCPDQLVGFLFPWSQQPCGLDAHPSLLRISAHRPSAGPQSRKFQKVVVFIKTPARLVGNKYRRQPKKPWMRRDGTRRPPFPPTGDREWLEPRPRRPYLLPTPLGRHTYMGVRQRQCRLFLPSLLAGVCFVCTQNCDARSWQDAHPSLFGLLRG